MENHFSNLEDNQIQGLHNKLEESELMVRSLIMQSPSGICILRADTLMTELVNDTFLEIAGKPRKLFEEQPYWAIFQEVASFFEPILKNVIDSGVAYHTEETPMTLIRHGVPELVYVSFVYEPIKDSKGVVAKVMVSVLDITSKVVSRKRIEKSEQNLRNTILQAPVAMAILRGAEHVVEIANNRMYELWGKRAEEVYQKPLFEGLPEAKNQGFEPLLSNVYHTGERFSAMGIPVNLPREQGLETIYINMLYEPYREENGEVSGIVVVANDITDQVKSKQRIEESEAKYRTLFDTMDQGFCMIEMIFNKHNQPIDYRFIEINPMFEKQTGLKNAEGKTALELLPNLETRWFEMYGNVALTGEPTRFTEGSQVMDRWFDVYAFRLGREESRKVALLFSDITERYRATAENMRYLKQIEESKDQLHFAIEAAELATWDYNPVTNTFTGNSRLKEWFGLEPKEEIDLSLALAVIIEKDRQRVIEAIQNALQFSSGGIYDIDYTLINPNTTQERIVNAKGRARFNEQGVAYRFNGTLQDITDRTKNEQSLKESELRFRNMVEQAPVAIAVFRGDNFVTELANEAYLPLVGKTREEFIGKPLFEALPETKEVLEPLAGELVATGKSFPASEFEIIINRKGKLETCYFNSVWEPYYEKDGSINGFIVVAHEITQQVRSRKKLEESEAQIRAMVESAPFPIGVYISKERRIQLANQAMLNAWGKGHDVIGKLYDQILPELTNQDIFNQLDKVYTTGVAFHAKNQRVDLVVERKLQAFYFNYSFTPLLDGEGKVYGVMNTAADVTDLALARKKSQESEQEAHRLAEELAASNEELSAANEEISANNEDIKAVNDQLMRTNVDLDNFIYTASHDLKAPISNIESLLAALLRTLPPESLASERASRITTLMQESVERFKRTIANLTEIVKLQKENSGEAVSVDLLQVIREVSLDLEPLIKQVKAQVEIDVASCPSIRFSEKNLRSVVYNLLSNSLKYHSPERVPQVSIYCQNIAEYQVLTIKDNGMGMESGRLSQLFTMFKRFHDHVEGSGIGLYMVKKIVDNAGGRIEVESHLGEGSTFRVYFKC